MRKVSAAWKCAGSRKASLCLRSAKTTPATWTEISTVHHLLALPDKINAKMILYPANAMRDSNGLLLVTLPDLPEVAAVGEEESEALHQAAEALEVAVGERIGVKIRNAA